MNRRTDADLPFCPVGPPRLAVVIVAALAGAYWLAEALPAEPSPGQTKSIPGRRWALLIGVDQYKNLQPLDYCGNDVRALADRLVSCGFPRDRVVVLHNKAESLDFQPLKANIEDQVKLVLGSAKEGDLVLLSFSGHGVQVAGRSFLCPYEAKLEDPATLVSMDGVFRALEDCPAAVKLFLVDACQNEAPQRGERTAAGARAVSDFAKWLGEAPPPKGTLLLTSCAPGEKSREADEFRHGVFMHYVLEGLEGRADSNANGLLTLSELFAYASDRTQDYVRLKYNALQRPRLRGDIVDFPLVEAVHPKEFTNSIGMKMVLIPAGEFMMGSPDSEPERFSDELPQHRVRITRPFYLGAYEVTVGQFRQFVEDTGYKTDAEKHGKGGEGGNESKGRFERDPKYTWRNPGFAQTDDHPVVNVSWNDAVAFAAWLSRKEGKQYRLPTEAEWEYACRAGTTTRYYFGDDPEGLVEVGNVADATLKARFPNSPVTTIAGRDGYVFTAPVGRFRPNAFGLYDMHGNVWEWCADWYEKGAYERYKRGDLTPPSGGHDRVLRGGSWHSRAPDVFRCACRNYDVPDDRNDNNGFRVARTLTP